MHRQVLAVVAVVVALTTMALPVEATVTTTHQDGWHFMVSNQVAASRTLIDRSPLSTYVAIFLQKKAGPTNCRATVTVTKNGHVWKWRNLQKWTRNYTRYGVWHVYPDTRDRTVGVRVNTNGHCVVGVGIR